MRKLLQKVSEWLRSRVTAITKVKSCIAAVSSDDAAGERLRDNGKRATLNIENSHSESSPSSSSKEDANPLLLLIEEFIDKHYLIRLNTLSQQYEVCERGTERWIPVSGTLCNRILMELNRASIVLAKPYLVKTVIEGGTLATPYHPVRSYLESLPEWDGTGHIEALFRRVTDDEQLSVGYASSPWWHR